MAPRFVVPYRKDGKNDGSDAETMQGVQEAILRVVQGAPLDTCVLPSFLMSDWGLRDDIIVPEL